MPVTYRLNENDTAKIISEYLNDYTVDRKIGGFAKLEEWVHHFYGTNLKFVPDDDGMVVQAEDYEAIIAWKLKWL